MFPTLLSALAIDPSAPDRVYAGTDSSGVFTSSVGGGAWQPTGAVDLVDGTIEALLEGGELTPDQAEGLMDKLDAARASLENGRTNALCEQLSALGNQVTAFIRTGALSATAGQTLLAGVVTLRSENGCR